MAGIYDIWEDHQTGEILHTFSIITTHANPLTGYIHNNKKRMPVILSSEEEQKWLDPKLSQSQIEEMMQPFDEKKMDAYIIHKDFIRKNPKDKSILEAA